MSKNIEISPLRAGYYRCYGRDTFRIKRVKIMNYYQYRWDIINAMGGILLGLNEYNNELSLLPGYRLDNFTVNEEH